MTAVVAGPQQPVAGDGSFWQWLLALGREPGVVEFLLTALVLGAVVLCWWRLARLVRNAQSRAALGDYLLGVEQALHGDLGGAHRRLAAVVARDPENHYARLLLGKVLAERGAPEEAHQQHVCLKTAFGIDSLDNELLLARSLLAAGLAREAADTAERALQRAPEQAAGWDFVYRARLQSSDLEPALAAGRRLLGLLRDGTARRRFADDLASTLAAAGSERLQRGDAAGAAAMLQDARRLSADAVGVPLLAARLEASTAGVPSTVQRLLTDGAATAALVPLGSAAAIAAPAVLPMAALAGLEPPARFCCRACRAPLADAVAECPRCRAVRPATLREPRLVDELASPLQAMDAIDVNDAHVQRLVRRVLEGPGDGRAAARTELLELRELAVPQLLRAAWQQSGTAQDAAVEVLRAMGPAIAPSLFAASDALQQERLLPLGSRSPAALVGRIVQGFDRAALPHVQPLFASARPEHRKILIDFFLGLADLDQFQLVLERFPPVEILHRLNKADGDVLRRFVQAVPRGHFVAETLLVEPTFDRDDELLAAIPGAADPDVLIGVLLRRGPTRGLGKVLVGALAEPSLAGVAERVLVELGPGMLEHVLVAFGDPECSPGERVRLARVLVLGGAAASALVVDCFGPEPTALDDELRAVLAGIGDAAVPVLQAAYGHQGWLERVSIGLISRHTNRRVQIIAALRAIGSGAALQALQVLADGERDANLRLRLSQAMHDVTGGEGGGDGPHR